MPYEDQMLRQAVEALARGDRAEARELLTRLLRADKSNPDYWLYLSAAVDSEQERVFCLEQTLALDPENEAARRGLILLGSHAPEATVEPVRPPHPRAWSAVEPPVPAEERATSSGLRPAALALALGIALVVLGLLLWGGYRLWDRYRPRTYPTPALLIYATPDLTATWMPTATSTPSILLHPGEPTPLWMLLPATYTPTPLPLNTPHPMEAYRLGLSAYRRGHWREVVSYMQQVVEASGGQAADAYYYLGEAYTHLKDYPHAQEAYRAALAVDPTLAPAYLGMARLKSLMDPQADVRPLLDAAIQANPQYGVGYLERARYRLHHGDPEGALKDLAAAEPLLAGSPLVPLYRAEAYLLLGEVDKAYEQAKLAHQDLTLLPAYKVLAQIELAFHHPEDAAALLKVYVQHRQEDAEAFLWLAQAYRSLGKPDLALQAAQRAHRLRPRWEEAAVLMAASLVDQGTAEAARKALEVLKPWHSLRGEDYSVNFWMGRAYFQLHQAGDAYWAFHAAVQAAEPEGQDYYRAVYWRAKALTALETWDAAYRDWKTVMQAPPGMVPDEWRAEAEEQMSRIRTPTPGPSLTPSLPSSPTLTPTSTPRP